MARRYDGQYVYGEPDGNLAAEFLLSTSLATAIQQEQSNDAFTCRLNAGAPGPTEPMAACLDIAAVSTLTPQSGVLPLVPYSPDVAEQVANLSSVSPSTVAPFGGADECGGARLGDGTVNGYDVAVFMWSHFGVTPYDALGISLSEVRTVTARGASGEMCTAAAPAVDGWTALRAPGAAGARVGLSRAEYTVLRADDFCTTPDCVTCTRPLRGVSRAHA